MKLETSVFSGRNRYPKFTFSWNLRRISSMRSGIPGTGNGPVFRTSITFFPPCWLGPCHAMRFSTVFNHPLRLHVHEVAAGPPAYQYGSEMHPDMVVDSPMVGGSIGTERAIGIIGLDCGGDSIYKVGFPCRNQGHGPWTYYIVQPDVLLFPVLLVVAVYDIPVTVLEHACGTFRSVLVPTGHPQHHRKGGLDNLLSLFEAFCRFISYLAIRVRRRFTVMRFCL